VVSAVVVVVVLVFVGVFVLIVLIILIITTTTTIIIIIIIIITSGPMVGSRLSHTLHPQRWHLQTRTQELVLAAISIKLQALASRHGTLTAGYLLGAEQRQAGSSVNGSPGKMLSHDNKQRHSGIGVNWNRQLPSVNKSRVCETTGNGIKMNHEERSSRSINSCATKSAQRSNTYVTSCA